MSDEEPVRPPASAYEVTWMTGHVETVLAHQVTWPGNASSLFGAVATKTIERVVFHAYVNDKWTLMLDARVEDIRTIRNKVTEEILGGE